MLNITPNNNRTWYSRFCAALLLPLDRFCNWLFTSEYNPIYRSGTIAAFLLSVVTVTGFYLVFFYNLSAPYESIQDIQTNVFLGSWLRTLHRYASDAAVVSVVLHVLRMVAQGKTWGGRTLAWMSGSVLTVFLLISAWTGYVMVWDVHGQTLAIAGAKVFDSIGIVADSISRGFNGEIPTPLPSFFFLNLFLHIVVPLAMIFGLWIHTAKMARATWLPSARVSGAFFLFMGLGSFLWPTPLLVKGNLLKIPDLVLYDGFFQFWLPWVSANPQYIFYIFLTAFLLLLTVPIWLKPSKAKQLDKAFNEELRCHGCSQCVVDCPYEAIRMVPRSVGEGSPLVAFVDDDLCISCGLCGASCDTFTIGQNGHRGSDLLKAARDLVKKLQEQGQKPEDQLAIVACQNQCSSLKRVEHWAAGRKNVEIIPVECAGTVHTAAMEYFSRTFKHLIISACPERNCQNKDAYMLLNGRMSGARHPTFTKYFDPKKLTVVSAGDGEEFRIYNVIKNLNGLKESSSKPSYFSFSPRQLAKQILTVAVGLGFIFLISMGSHLKYKSEMQESMLRLSWRLTDQFISTCKSRTEAELRVLPAHMRTKEVCEKKPVTFQLKLFVDNEIKIEESIRAGGFRHDRPIYVHHDVKVSKGLHQVSVQFLPIEDEATEAVRLKYDFEINLDERDIALITLAPDKKTLFHKTPES